MGTKIILFNSLKQRFRITNISREKFSKKISWVSMKIFIEIVDSHRRKGKNAILI